MVGRNFAWFATTIVAASAVVGCAAENGARQPTAAEVHTALPRAVGESGALAIPYEAASAEDAVCAENQANAFDSCVSSMFSRGRYRAMVRACDAAVKTPRTDGDRQSVRETCVSMLPPALWVANARPEAVSVLSAACDKQDADERIERAARAAVLTLHGIERGALDLDDKRHSMRDAVVAFAAACEVDPKRAAARAVAIEHGAIAKR